MRLGFLFVDKLTMHWNSNICRICGQISDLCALIYSKDSTTDTLEEKIKEVLKLEIFKDDFKPKQICNDCSMKLEDFHQFLETCYAADQKFDSLLINQRSEWSSDNIVDYTQTQQKMSVIVTPKTTIVQLDCNEIESVLPLDPIDDEMLDIVENATYTNLQDNFDYLNPSGYIKKFTQQEFYPEATVLRHSSDYQQESSPNNSVVLNYSNPKNSEENNFPTYDNVGIDYSNFERPSEDFTSFVNENKSKVSVKYYQCPHCDRKFKRRGSLNNHVAIHTKIRPFICETCKKCYATKCDLTTHKKVHTDIHKCKFCTSAFPAPSKLERHLRTHTKDKPFICDFENCGKSFSDKCNLDAHKIVVHSTDYNHRCEICLKAFKTGHKLRLHQNIHKDSFTPFTCEICSKSYKFKSSLIQHLKKHNGYFCPHCDKDCEGFAKFMKHKRTCPSKK